MINAKTLFEQKIILKKVCIFFVILFGFSFNAISQQINFAKSYHIGYNSNAYSFVELPDSGFILVGSTRATPLTPEFSFAMRLDKYGDTLWTKKYFPNASDIIGSSKVNDSTYILSGGFILPGSLLITVAKINLSGDTLWRGEYGYSTPGSGGAGRINKTPNGGYVMSNSYLQYDYGLIKLDSGMNVQWHISELPICPGCSEIVPDLTGGYVAVGGLNGTAERYGMGRIDSAGTVIWQSYYGNQPAWDTDPERFATDVVVMPDSNYIVGTNGYDWQLMKIDHTTGDTIWTRNYYDTVYNYKYAVSCMDYAGNNNFIIGTTEYFMLVDAIGDTIWQKQKPFYAFASADVHTTSDGGYAFCGYIYDPGLTYLPIGFVKLDSLGNTVLVSVFEPENNMQPLTFFPNPAGGELYISPGSMASERDLQFTMYDLQGRTVLQQQYDATSPVNVSTIPRGLYIATLKGKEKEVRGKVMVE